MSPLQAYAIGLLHGVAGSAAVSVLLLAARDARGEAALALCVFAVATTLSMALLSTAFGYALGRERVVMGFARIVAGVGLASLAFGGWFALQAAV